MELFGEGKERLCKKLDLLGVDGYLPRLGAEHKALNADDVTDVPLFEIGIAFLAHIVTLDVELDLALAVVHMHEGCLAHYAAAHHSAGTPSSAERPS